MKSVTKLSKQAVRVVAIVIVLMSTLFLVRTRMCNIINHDGLQHKNFADVHFYNVPVQQQNKTIMCTTNTTKTTCPQISTCGAALEVYDTTMAKQGHKWWYCPKIHDILWACLKPSREGRLPLPNFYLENKPDRQEYLKANLAFIHIPKCGGTSVNNLVYDAAHSRNVKDIRHCDQFRQLAYDIGLTKSRIFMVSKRVYGLHEFATPNRPFLYFVWFRNPLKRFESQFYYLKNFPNEYRNIIKNKTLTEFLQKHEGQCLHYFDNFAVRLLQFGDHREIDDSYEMRDGSSLPGFAQAPLVTEEHFLSAKRNLLNNIGFVGILEDFETSQKMLCFLLELKCPDVPIYKNKNEKKVHKQLSEYEIQEIVKRNEWDLKLYQIALDIYEKQKIKYLGMKNRKLSI